MKFAPLFVSLIVCASASAQSHWWVSPTGNDADPGDELSPFQTINHAATVAASGDVIHLFAATYGDEQGSLVLGSKDLSLVGAGVGQTIINAHSSLDTILPAGLLATPTAEAHRCSIALQGAAETYIRDLTLDQGFSVPGNGRAYCLWVGTGADAVLDNVECKNARANPINGIQNPLGVNVRGDGLGDTTNVTMRNCFVHEYGKGGIVANYDAHLEIDDCTVQGAGHVPLGLAAQNCIQVSRGASCEIRRTAILDSWYDPATVVATGMLFYDASSVIVEDCSIVNAQAGIYFFGTPATIPATVRRNRVHTSTYAFTNFDLSGLNVSENSFSITQGLIENDVYDTGAGNTYDNNFYSSQGTDGSYVIPGGGGATDSNAHAFNNAFGSSFATNLPAGYAPIDLAVTDLNGDGEPDFAALCQNGSPALAIGLNSGGAFTVSGLPFGSSSGDPVAIATGEFNGAAGVDVAVLTSNLPPSLTENKVYIFANDGVGGFTLLHTHMIAAGTAPRGLAAGDVNGDSADDLVVADAGSAGLVAGSATVLSNNGTGTAFVASPLAAGYTVACRDASIGDFNGDTFADVAVIEGDAGTGLVHLFEGDGVGGFVAYAGSPLACALNPSKAQTADVEGDGDVDLLVTSAVDAFGIGEGALEVFRNNAGVLDSSLYVVDRGPTAIATGELDNDADPDTLRRDVALVNLTAGSISVLGGWSDQGPTTGGIAYAGSVVSGLGIGDVDADGFGDLVYSDAAAGTIVVIRGAATARADTYGAGTGGTGGLIANLYPVGNAAVPSLGNATFGLGLRNARPFSIAVIAAGLNPTPIVPGGILIADIGATWAVVTNFAGRAAVPLPIPVTPALAGFEAYCQAGIFDPAGTETILSGFVVTNGLKVRVGN